jgi:serine/threonine-protein kinase
MGVVYRAHDETLRRDVALKVLPETTDDERRQRFLREARSAAGISHPNVAVVHQVGEDGGRAYIAMELVDGESLRQRLDRGPLGVAAAMDLARQIARGLAAAHDKGLVHRDLKPENVMIAADGVVKLLDFGLAKAAERSAQLESGEATAAPATTVTSDRARVMGTPEYMSPEQAMSAPLDARSDVFSLGLVLYEMLAGKRPYGDARGVAAMIAIARDAAPPLRTARPEIDEATEAIVVRCLAKAPEERYASAGEVVAALGGEGRRPADVARSPKAVTLEGPETRPVASPPATPETSETPEIARRPRSTWMVATLAFAVLAVVTAAVWSRVRSIAAPESPDAGLQLVRLTDIPLPKTDNPQALTEYRRALADVYDAAEAPQSALARAIALDPTFAAAHLRTAFAMERPASTRSYREAVRYRDKLDARDQALLVAEEPCDVPEVPDYAECKRRFLALAAEQPGDVEILWRIGAIERRVEQGSQLATFERIAQLDPKMAGAEYVISYTLVSLDRLDEAKLHVNRCEALSPTAAQCMWVGGRIGGMEGRCEDLADAVRRMSVVAPDDLSNPLDTLGVSLVMGQSPAEAEALAERIDMLLEHLHARITAPFGLFLRGTNALWFGDFTTSYKLLNDWTLATEAGGSGFAWTYEQLVAAEEMGDEDRVKAFLARYVAERGAPSPAAPWGPTVLRAIREHHALAEARTAALEDAWRRAEQKSARLDAWQTWLAFDAIPALTPDEARAALALPASRPPNVRLEVDAAFELGRVLLLAGRPAEAIPRLEAAASSCEPLTGYNTFTFIPPIVRAALLLGEAREATGDRGGACEAYSRVLQRWGGAKPRSVTAEDARSRAKRLGCGP